jgi:hypothetical protein
MVAIEDSDELLSLARWNPRRRDMGLIFGMTFGVVLAWATFLLRGGDMNAARFAANVVLYAASLVFILYYVALPLSRLIRSTATEALGEERFALAYGFAGVMGVYLVCTLVPETLAGGHVSLPTLAYAVLTSLVAAVFLISAGSKRAANSVTLRSLQSLSSGYFWFAFAVVDLDRMVGPHRPDGHVFGISILLLVGALLIRFADALVLRFNAGMSQRAV